MSEHVEIPSSEACLSSRVLSLHPVSCCSRAIVLMASDKIEGERAIPLPLKLVFDPILVVDVVLVTLTFFCGVFLRRSLQELKTDTYIPSFVVFDLFVKNLIFSR